MQNMALPRDHAPSQTTISYAIYTIERLPKGSKRTPKWDLHSTANDRATAENHARTLAAQPYFDYIEVQEFKIDPQTQERRVSKIKSYSRKSLSRYVYTGLAFIVLVTIALII